MASATLRAALLAGTVVVGLVGLVFIYGFGAGYYSWVHAPTPWNVVLSVSLVVCLGLVLMRTVKAINRR